MTIFAAATTSSDKLRDVPPDLWLKLALGVAVLIAVVIVLRKVADINRFVLLGLALFASTVIGFNWIYERNEPAFATPFVAVVSGFFPAKPKATVPAKPAPPIAAKKA
jgi:apolipoprotein N-acyltransferase